MGIFEPSEQMSWSQSIASRVATRASHLAKLESEPGPKTRGIFGPSSSVSFAYFDRDSSSWKMCQATFLSDLEQFSETWPDSGIFLNGCVYERRISGPPTSERESLLWPTAVAYDDQKTPEAHLRMKQRMGERDGTHANRTAITSLAVKVQTWPTAQAHDATGPRGKNNYLADHHYKPHDLAMAGQNWPTAGREDGESAGNHPGASDSLTGVTGIGQRPGRSRAAGNRRNANRSWAGRSRAAGIFRRRARIG